MSRTSQSKSRRMRDPIALGFTEAKTLVSTLLTAGMTTFLRGSPGTGKSSLARALAAEMSLPFFDIRLAQCEPAEIAGVHFPDKATGALRVYPPTWLKSLCATPGFLFLDELNAPGLTKLHQAAALQLTLDRRLGDLCLHPETVILAAGNLEDDGAYVTALSSALANRFAHVTLSVDVDSWLAWGTAQGIAPEILAYIGQGGADLLYRNDGGYAFPSPRSWAMASRMLTSCADERLARQTLTACVGPRAAEEFRAFVKIYQRINPLKVIEKGQIVDFTKGRKRELSFMYAATFAVAGWLRKHASLEDAYLPNVVQFLTSPGLGEEFQFLFLRHLKEGTDLVQRLKAVDGYRDCARKLLGLNLELYA